ncbi:hypothetical protein [Meridianimarinicoccus roseus]|uniref:hypothetical protein n=1 Tax=Meridianimarinicoccus roseus TaxID=2072018 RepID=UPI0011B24546|nr:hypothetical protein [Meridianimarinicoccus roseus]
MSFPIPSRRNRDTVDVERDERKRQKSPGSFFYSQGKGQVLAACYFSDERLAESARGGIALKHRHRIHLALFGQLMASFEYFLKDFVAKAVDATTLLDEKIKKEKWLEINVDRVLANRSGMATIGSTLVHSTLGWHSPAQVNARYCSLFNRNAFGAREVETLEKLWILRHSVAHNAGMIIHYDATRIGDEMLADHAAEIDAAFISETFNFLSPISKTICEECGGSLLRQQFQPLYARGPDYLTDMPVYARLKPLFEYVDSRARELSQVNKTSYQADFARFGSP